MTRTLTGFDTIQAERDVSRVDTSSIERFLESGRREDCRSTVEGFFAGEGSSAMDSLIMRLYITIDIYVCARAFTRRLGISTDEFTKEFDIVDNLPKNLATAEDTKEYFTRMFYKCICWRMERCKSESVAVICKAQNYIQSNYDKDGICLRSVASEVGLSPAYFSALFKRESGVNFIDYLTDVRMDKAKELLCCTSMQVSQIAARVGFSDYRYFGRIFKKTTGMTPVEFQQKQNS